MLTYSTHEYYSNHKYTPRTKEISKSISTLNVQNTTKLTILVVKNPAMIGEGEMLRLMQQAEVIPSTNSVVCALRELCSNYLIRNNFDPAKECSDKERGCLHSDFCIEIDACAQP